jgi:hypothetical protein
VDIDLSDIILDFAVDVTRIRFGAPTKSAGGLVTAPSGTSSTIRGTIEPISTQTMNALPEGLRETSRYVLYTAADVRSIDKPTGALADKIVYAGHVFEVVWVDAWNAQGNFHRCIMADTTIR